MTRLFNLFIIVFVVVLGTEARAAEPTVETKIVGGSPVPTASVYPWMVMLSQSASTSGFFCGASLISEKWVLTAAHCVVDASVGSLYAFVGEHDKTTADISANAITKIIVHPDYDANTSNNDIALLKLSNPEANLPINIITLAVASTLESQAGDFVDDVTVIGWGDTEYPVSGTYPDILHEVTLPYISNSLCNDPQYLNGQVTANMMCAGLPAGGVDSCQGDSGGPLIFSDGGQWYQAGIVSWGYGCAEPDSFGVYTRVEKYIAWIEKALTITPSVDFGTWITGKTVSAQIEFENTTTSMLTFTATGNSIFEVAGNDCSSTIAVGNVCTINVNFLASITGNYNGVISVQTDGSLGTLTVDVSGNIADVFTVNYVESNSEIVWALGGDNNWSEQQVTTDGWYSLQSGDVADNQSSSLFAYVTVPVSGTRTVYFDWKACSEPDYDFLELWVDNVKKDALSGDADWAHKSVVLTGVGDHVVEWRYNKDYTVTAGADAGWLDNIELDTASTNPLPVHSSSCNIASQPTGGGGGGGALSGWFYLGLGLPLLARRRRQI